jgi:hypothetical protein
MHVSLPVSKETVLIPDFAVANKEA